MNLRSHAGRLVVGATIACLMGCSAGGGDSPATQAAVATATSPASRATTVPTPTTAPTATNSLPTASPVYDASSVVSIHIESPECVTKPEEAGTTSYVNGVRQMRGWARHCRYDGADPRFSGWSEIAVNSDCYLADYSRCVRWGTERIPGPDGDWVGTYRGGQLGDGVRFNFEVLEGTGAYEGWTYVVYMNMAALGGEEWVIDGFVYQGPPPPVPSLMSAPSE